MADKGVSESFLYSVIGDTVGLLTGKTNRDYLGRNHDRKAVAWK